MKTQQRLDTTSRSEITLDRTLSTEALVTTTRQLSDILRRHGRGDRRIPHLEWTVGQCVAHMLISDWMYAHQLVGPGIVMQLDQTSEFSDWSVEPAVGLDPATVADDLERSTAHVVDVVSGLGNDASFTWWSGSSARVDTAIGLLVGERLVHGWDIAKALDVPWDISPDHAALALDASVAVMPLLVDPDAASGLNAVYEMRLRGAESYELRFVDGRLTTSRAVRVADAQCRISADPVAMLLVGYGRVSQWGQLARGRIVARGRKPWLALNLARVLRQP